MWQCVRRLSKFFGTLWRPRVRRGFAETPTDSLKISRSNNTGTGYPYGVTATWVIVLGAYAAVIYLNPIREPVDKMLMWDGLLGLFTAASILGSVAHPNHQLLAGLGQPAVSQS